jgi:hypothetical protein
MKALSEHLTMLTITAEDIMRRPIHALPSKLGSEFEHTASEIRRFDASPSEGIRSTRAGVIMCTAIEAFFAGEAGDHHWQMVIGAVLPLVRREAFQALKNEKEAARETMR